MNKMIYRQENNQGGGNLQAAANENDAPMTSSQPGAPIPASGGLTMRDLLMESVGYHITSEHLVGTSDIQVKQGLLIRVESNCYVLFDEKNHTSTACDYYSLKFFRRWPRNQAPPANTPAPMPRNSR